MSAFHSPFVRGNALWILLSHIPSLETKTISLHEPVLWERWVTIPVSQTCTNPTSHLRVLFSFLTVICHIFALLCLYGCFVRSLVVAKSWAAEVPVSTLSPSLLSALLREAKSLLAFLSASHPTASEKPVPLSLPSCLLAFLLYLKLYFFGFWLPLSPSSWTHPVTWQKDQERKWRHKHGTNLLCYKNHVKIHNRVVVSPSSAFCSLK